MGIVAAPNMYSTQSGTYSAQVPTKTYAPQRAHLCQSRTQGKPRFKQIGDYRGRHNLEFGNRQGEEARTQDRLYGAAASMRTAAKRRKPLDATQIVRALYIFTSSRGLGKTMSLNEEQRTHERPTDLVHLLQPRQVFALHAFPH